VAGALHVEEGGGLVGVLEDEAGGEVDRRGARAELRVGLLAGVQAQGVEVASFARRASGVSGASLAAIWGEVSW
jgi:hypothetical protein